MSDLAEEGGLLTDGQLVGMFVFPVTILSCLKIVSELFAATMSWAAEAL